MIRTPTALFVLLDITALMRRVRRNRVSLVHTLGTVLKIVLIVQLDTSVLILPLVHCHAYLVSTVSAEISCVLLV